MSLSTESWGSFVCLFCGLTFQSNFQSCWDKFTASLVLSISRGRGIAVEMSRALTTAIAVQGKYPGFALYRQKGP